MGTMMAGMMATMMVGTVLKEKTRAANEVEPCGQRKNTQPTPSTARRRAGTHNTHGHTQA